MTRRSTLHRQTAGSVLIIVLVICLGLVSIALVFSNAMLLAYRGEDNDLASHQAQNAVEGAARYAVSLLTAASSSSTGTGTSAISTRSLTATVVTPGTLPDPLTYQNSAVPLGPATFWFIGRPQPSDPTDQPVFGLVDESSKLNLNRANATILARLPGMTDDLAAAIVAWRTSASSSGGSGTQLILDNSVKAAPFESVEELAQVNGGTDLSILYGSDANLNHIIDPEEGAIAGTVGQWAPGLLEYVTVFSRQPNTLSDGSKRANVNPVNIGTMSALLTTALGQDRANALMPKLRSGPPAFQPRQFNSPLALYAALQPDMTADEFDKIAGKLTASGGTYTTGLVNVNTAGQTVLACVLNDDNIAAQIVTARASRTQPSTGFAWVYPLLSATAVANAGKYLTGQSFQFSADIAAVGRHGRGYRRTRFVIDTGGATPQIVYRRDLSSLGWALGSNVRQNLTQIVDSNTNAGGTANSANPSKGGTTKP